jgi:hypothetical protein
MPSNFAVPPRRPSVQPPVANGNYNDIIRAGLVAEYRFDEYSRVPGSTILFDYSGNGFHGTFGAAGAKPTLTAQGISFDGGDYITCPQIGLGTGPLSIICAMKANNTTSSYTIISNAALIFNENLTLYTRTDSNGYVALCVNPAGIYKVISMGDTPSKITNPVIISAVYDGSTSYIQFNNEPRQTESPASAAVARTATNLIIGKELTPFSGFNGTIYYLCLYNRYLSQIEANINFEYIRNILKMRGVSLG